MYNKSINRDVILSDEDLFYLIITLIDVLVFQIQIYFEKWHVASRTIDWEILTNLIRTKNGDLFFTG